MGKPDIAVKNWLSNKARFADFFNGTIFKGKQVIIPHDLTIMNSEAAFIAKDKSNKHKDKGVQKYRDITMSWKSNITLMILACEIQDKVNYAMPVRNMLYDSLSYTEQMKRIWNELSDEDKKNITGDEFFSRFRKEDKLHPVITLVFYYGPKKWDGNNDIYDMFDIPPDENMDTLMGYVPNYRINLIEPINFSDSDASSFKTDLQMILGMLRYRQDGEKMVEYINRNESFFKTVDLETAQAIKAMLKSDKIITFNDNNGGERNMCEALVQIEKHGDITRILKQICAKVKKNKPLDIIADELESTVTELKPLYDAVMACGADKDIEEIYKYYMKMSKQQEQ